MFHAVIFGGFFLFFLTNTALDFSNSSFHMCLCGELSLCDEEALLSWGNLHFELTN